MSGTSLLLIVMPTVVPIVLAVLIALPFLAARNPSRNPSRGIASGVPAEAEDSTVAGHRDSESAAARTQRPPEDQASPDAA
jgi:hypothetical protein